MNRLREYIVRKLDERISKLAILRGGLDAELWPDEYDQVTNELVRLQETRSRIVKKCKPIYEENE